MAAQTVSVNRNLDDAAISGLLNGEAITIDTGAVLTCDSDNRWSQQAAVVGSVTVNSTTGGRQVVDARNVWQIPFSASTGNVPSLGAVGVQDSTGGTSGATGEFLGVWATGESVPRTAGGAMPVAGYVKFRSKVGTFQAAETVTLPGGATITATDSGKRSWLNFVASYQGTLTLPRLGQFEAYGDWYDLGTTNGSNDQQFEYPIPDICGCIWVETAPSSGIYRKYLNGGARWQSATATIDTDARGEYFGQRAVTITATTVNGSAVISTASTTELVVGMPVNAAANFANLALYIVSINPGVSFTVNANANAATSTTFTTWTNKITLAKSAAPAMGLLPASGCKVRCPNLKLSTSVSGWAGNILATAIADRYEFLTTAAGAVIMDTVDCGWYINLSAPYSVELSRVAIALNLVASNVATTVEMDDCATYFENGTNATGLTLSNNFGGGTITNCRFHRYGATNASDNAASLVDCSDYVFTDCEFRVGGTSSTSRLRNNADIRALILTRCFRITLTRPSFITGRLNINSSIDVTLNDVRFSDLEQGLNPGATNALVAAVDCNAAAANIYWDGGFSNYGGIANVHPYTAILLTASGCSGVEWRGVGTASAPYDGGTTNALRSVLSSAVTSGLVLRRIYTFNTATSFAAVANTCQNVELVNCWADGADVNSFSGVNQVNKGCRFTNGTAGQSAVYGSHWEDAFTSTTAGRIVIKGNEPTADSAAQCAVTAGTPKFTSTGNVAMPTLGDQVTWEMPYALVGHTSLANTTPTITGTNTGNFSLEFQWKTTGAYNGSWLALTGANLSGIGAFTALTLKVRATTTVANSTNAITYIRIDTVTDATAQQLQFPLPVVTQPASVSWQQTGSRVFVYNVTTSTEIYNDVPAGLSLDLSYPEGSTFTTGDEIRVRVRKPGFTPVVITTFATASGWSSFASQTADLIYGSTTPANVTVDYVNKKIRATGARASFTATEVVDVIRNAEATIDGIRLPYFADISGLVELSPGVSTAITVNLIDWQLSWAAGSVAQATVGGGNIVGGILGDPVEDVVGGPQVTVNVSAAATVVTAGGSVPSAADNAAAVWAYVVRTLTSGGGGLTAQQTRDAMLLAPTGGGAAGSIDTVLSTISGKVAPLPAAPAAVSDIPTTPAVADAILGRNLAGGSDGGRTVRDALRSSRNKVEITGGTLTVYAEDDTTPAWTAAVATSTRDALQSVDPA